MCSNNNNPNNSSDLLAVLASRRPNSAEKPTTVSEKDSTHRDLWGKLRSKGQNVWILFVTIIFLKPEDGRGKFQRPVCRARVRHPDSLQVLLEFSAGRKCFMTEMGGLGYRHFGRLQRRVQIFSGSEKCFFDIFSRCTFVCVFVICLSLVLGGCRCPGHKTAVCFSLCYADVCLIMVFNAVKAHETDHARARVTIWLA